MSQDLPNKDSEWKCKRCGYCCMFVDMIVGEMTKENEEIMMAKGKYLDLHRCDVFLMKTNNVTTMMVRVPLMCKNLSFDKDHKSLCKDYAYRPLVCRKFKCNQVMSPQGNEKLTSFLLDK